MKTNKTLTRFILAVGMVIFSFGWFTLLIFKEAPAPNRDIVTAFSGFLLGTGLSLIYQFYFGSSQGSVDKTDMAKNGGGA